MLKRCREVDFPSNAPRDDKNMAGTTIRLTEAGPSNEENLWACRGRE